MARRAIKDLYLELASLRHELKVVEQQVRVSLRPRLDLELLLPEKSGGFIMRPTAPDFVSTLSEVLPEYIESVGKTGSFNLGPPMEKDRLSIEASETESDDPVVDRQGKFRQYYRSNFKPIADIWSLGSLKGNFWEQLPDDQALGRTFQSFQKRDFVNVSRCMEKCTYVYDSFCKVLPLVIQQEATTLKHMEVHFDETKKQLDEALETACDLRSRASKCQDNPVGRSASSATMRDVEALIAKQLALHDKLAQEKADAGRTSVAQRLRLEILQNLAPALEHGREDVAENLQNQWEKLGL